MDGNLAELVETDTEYEVADKPTTAQGPGMKSRLPGIAQFVPGYPNWIPPTLRFGDLTFTPFPDLGLRDQPFEEASTDPQAVNHCTTAPTLEDSCSAPDPTVASLATEQGRAPGNPDDSTDQSFDTADPETFEAKLQRLQLLSELVRAGDQSAIREIQQILADDEKLWQCLGNAELATETMLIEYMAGTAANKEAVRFRVVELKRSLVSDNATALEQLAAGRVVACWLFAQFIDRWCGFAIKESGRTTGLAKLLESSEKRLQTAIKSLKLVQGMQ